MKRAHRHCALALTLVTCTHCAPSDRAPVVGASSTGSEAAEAVPTALWHDATVALLPTTSEWTNRVEVADLDGDGDIDILFANGGGYSTPGEPQLNRVFLNQGSEGPFVEVTQHVLGSTPDFARAIKVRDLDADGLVDIVVACAYDTSSRLYRGLGGGDFEEITRTAFPRAMVSGATGWSFGDVEIGDVDDDGDLDLVFADWGAGDAMRNDGGSPRLWFNQLNEEGTLRFVDATAGRLPPTGIEFSWDLELYDVDNDLDLDILASCKRCGGGVLLRGDGAGSFQRAPTALPRYTNNYDYEGMDLNGDGAIDLVTVNDGDIVGRGFSRREHVLINQPGHHAEDQAFADRSAELWPAESNIGEDDNAVAFLDFDSDGDADFLLASLTGPDRLLINDGGTLRLAADVFLGEDTPGTLGLALADLDGDRRLDVVMAQGEHDTAVDERIFLGTGLAPDTSAPFLGELSVQFDHSQWRVRVRIHDRKSPVQAEDFQEIRLDLRGGVVAAMNWYGGQLWRSEWLPGAPTESIRVCARDRAGNEECRE